MGLAEDDLADLAGDLSTEKASGPVGERDVGLAMTEYAPIVSQRPATNEDGDAAEDWSPVAIKVVANAELQNAQLAADPNYDITTRPSTFWDRPPLPWCRMWRS